jgi:hypothetical protein
MKNLTSILLCFLGGVLMIIGSATGSAAFYFYLANLASSYISPDFMPLVASILLGKIIITVATGFGMLGLVFYVGMWILGYSGIAVNPTVQTILNQMYSLFTYNSGVAFTGTVLAVLGRYGIKKGEKEDSTEKAKSNDSTKP